MLEFLFCILFFILILFVAFILLLIFIALGFKIFGLVSSKFDDFVYNYEGFKVDIPSFMKKKGD